MLVLPQCHAEQQVQPVSSWILVTSGQSSFSHTLAAQTPSYPQHLPSAKCTPLSPRCLRSPQLSCSQQPLQHQLTRWIQTKSLGTALTAPKLPCRFYCFFFFFLQTGRVYLKQLPAFQFKRTRSSYLHYHARFQAEGVSSQWNSIWIATLLTSPAASL